MVTPVHTTTNALRQKEKLARIPVPTSPVENLGELGDLRLRLSQILPSSLELDEVLAIFFRHIQEAVSVDGLSYHSSGEDKTLQLGKASVHHCDYRLNVQQEYLGEIIFQRSKRFDESELASLEALLGCLIYPVRNALRYQQVVRTAMHDPLTNTGNRIALDNMLHRELRMAHRYGHDLSLLMIDIDHFKHVNDTHGHIVGDQVLKEIAQAIQSVSRQTDMTFRYGGEEFVVVLPDTQGINHMADNCRKAIKALNIPHVCSSIADEVTISIGCSTLVPSPDFSVNHLIGLADKALYQAKHEGRNRVNSAECVSS